MAEARLMRGNQALAEAAIVAGCRHYFGYPITPQNEVPEYMSWRMPEAGGVFVQAESELAAINMVYGAAAAGARAMTSSSSPGVSLMQEGISTIAGAELPAVIVNMARGGPGVGNISPGQGDYHQSTRGGGHGDYRTIVLAPSTIQELVEHVIQAFDLADKWRSPVVVLGDGLLGQMMEPVRLPEPAPVAPREEKSDWTLTGAKGRPGRHIKTLYLSVDALTEVNQMLEEKYKRIEQEEKRWDERTQPDDQVLIAAFGTCGRVSRAALKMLRASGVSAGLFRPVTLWPFPYEALRAAASGPGKVLVVEMNMGQMLDDVRIAVGDQAEVSFFGKLGGDVPSAEEIAEEAVKLLGSEDQP